VWVDLVPSLLSENRLLSHRQGSISVSCTLGNTSLGSLRETPCHSVRRCEVSVRSRSGRVVGDSVSFGCDNQSRALPQIVGCISQTSVVRHKGSYDVPVVLLFLRCRFLHRSVGRYNYPLQGLCGQRACILGFGSLLFAQELVLLSSLGAVLFAVGGLLMRILWVFRSQRNLVMAFFLSVVLLASRLSSVLSQVIGFVQRSTCSLWRSVRTLHGLPVFWLRFGVGLSNTLGSGSSKIVCHVLCMVAHTACIFLCRFSAYFYYTMFHWEVQVRNV